MLITYIILKDNVRKFLINVFFLVLIIELTRFLLRTYYRNHHAIVKRVTELNYIKPSLLKNADFSCFFTSLLLCLHVVYYNINI